MFRALFICTQNRLRSPTAEAVFATWPGVETDSAGLGNDATVPLSVEQIEWATIIFVMEEAHRNKLAKKFKAYLRDKWVICLDIPDDYDFIQPELVDLLNLKVGGLLPWRCRADTVSAANFGLKTCSPKVFMRL
jgi:predicted protein tyrosine phosphatase